MTPFEQEISEILEQLHQKVAIGWIRNDGKPYALPTHATADSCITEALASIKEAVERHVIGEDEKDSTTSDEKINKREYLIFLMHRDQLRAEQRQAITNKEGS